MRYTPAGIPKVDAKVSVTPSERPAFEVQVVAFEAVAMRLAQAAIGAQMLIEGELQPASMRSQRLNILVQQFELM